METFEDNLKDPERYTGQRNRAIKIDFLSPLYGYTEIVFEKSKGVGKSFEASLGIIGAGKSVQLGYYNSHWERSTGILLEHLFRGDTNSVN